MCPGDAHSSLGGAHNLADGLPAEEIVASYPSLTLDDIRAAVAYGAELARERVLDLPRHLRDEVKLDENLPGEGVQILRAAGHDAVTVLDRRLGGRPDPEIFAVVQAEVVRSSRWTSVSSVDDSFREIVCTLARSELNDAKIREAVRVKRVFLDDGLDLLPILAHGQDDPSVPRDLSARDEEISGSVILVQKRDVRGHVRVDFGEVNLVRELDDEHRR